MNQLTKFEAPDKYRGNPVFNNPLRNTVLDALNAVEGAAQKCFIAGQMLNEAKARCEHGQFKDEIVKLIPEISYETAARWMRATGNIARALQSASGAQTVDISVETIPVSHMLTMPDAELTPDQIAYKQAWFDFTSNKTIKQCAEGVFVEGDEAHRMDRAVNGKTKGGVGKQTDRKAIEVFTATKLKHITTFLTKAKQGQVTGWKTISPVQQTQIGAAFCAFLQTAPDWLLATLADKIKTESKMSPGERLAR